MHCILSIIYWFYFYFIIEYTWTEIAEQGMLFFFMLICSNILYILLFTTGYRWTYLFLSTWSIDQNQWLFINLLIVLHCQLLKINEFFIFQMFTCKVKKNLTEKTKTEFFGKKRSHQPKIEWPTSFSLISFSSVSAKVKGAGALPEVKCFLYPDKFTSSLK